MLDDKNIEDVEATDEEIKSVGCTALTIILGLITLTGVIVYLLL